MKPLYIILAANLALLASASAADPDKPEISKKPTMSGKFVAKDDLPQAVKSQGAKKEAKHPGFPGCQSGRIITTWDVVLKEFPETNKEKRPCSEVKEVYACQSFSKASVKCALE